MTLSPNKDAAAIVMRGGGCHALPMADVVIENREQLKTWLEDKPREWSQIIALRCALRVVPIIAENSWKYKSSDQKNLVLAIFRALAITSCSIQFQNNKMIKQEAAIVAFSAAAAADTADDAAQFSTDVNAAYVAYCAADAAFGITAATAIDASSFAYYTASEFPGDFAANVKNDLRLDIKYDVDALANNRLPEKLYCSPIWKSQSQRYVDLHAELKADFTALGDDFSLWNEWYQCRVDGKANAFAGFDRDANEQFYRFLVEQDDDWWKREPALVNGDIKALVDSLRKPKANKTDFFISYAHGDEAIAREVAGVLDQLGKSYVVQYRDFPQSNFVHAMNQGMANAERMIALYSERYMESDHCNAE